MSEKNKNKNYSLNRYLRYKNGEMNGKEKNAFEKELQRDPFAEEAFEGLSSIPSDAFENDINELRHKLEKKKTRRNYTLYYSIAASVAVLLVISSVFIMIQRKTKTELVADNGAKSVTLEIQASTPVNEPVEIKKEEPKKLRKLASINEVSSATGAVSSDEFRVAEAKPDSQIIEPIVAGVRADINQAKTVLAERSAAAPVAMALKKEAAKSYQLTGKLLSAEDNLPVPGASVTVKGTTTGAVTDMDGKFSIGVSDAEKRTLVANFIGMDTKEFEAKADTQLSITMIPSSLALNEVVVVGYGSRKSDLEAAPEPASFTPSKPSAGKAAFDKYIENNIRRPDTLTNGQRVVVVIGFTVRANGTRDNYKIIKSPSKPFSDEALRLVQNGPSWIPAEQYGIKTDDEVRLRIVFR
jgi:hypothetical protein